METPMKGFSWTMEFYNWMANIEPNSLLIFRVIALSELFGFRLYPFWVIAWGPNFISITDPLSYHLGSLQDLIS